jgi:hypothetical protein
MSEIAAAIEFCHVKSPRAACRAANIDIAIGIAGEAFGFALASGTSFYIDDKSVSRF